MHVRMEVAPAAVGMQHGAGADLTGKAAVVLCEAAQRIPGTAHQRIEHGLGTGTRQRAQLGRQGKGDHEIVDRQQASRLPLSPGLTQAMLAMRTGAVAAGVRSLHAPPAVGAGRPPARTAFGLAAAQRRQGPALRHRHPRPALRQQRGAKARHHRRKPHDRACQCCSSRSISRARQSRVLAAPTSVSWA